jgi:hypothetical protein
MAARNAGKGLATSKDLPQTSSFRLGLAALVPDYADEYPVSHRKNGVVPCAWPAAQAVIQADTESVCVPRTIVAALGLLFLILVVE